jgi:hypothetical protein
MIVLGFLLKQQLFLMQVFGLECAQSVTLMAKRNEVPWVRYVH